MVVAVGIISQSTTSVAEDLDCVGIWSTDRRESVREVNTQARSGRRGVVAVGGRRRIRLVITDAHNPWLRTCTQ